jgi:hypothetical protein
MFRLGVFLAALATATGTIEDCGGSSSLFKITDLSQDPPSTVGAGQNVSMTLKYSVSEEVTAGRVVKSVTYNYIPFDPTEEDLCTNAACPLMPGDHDGSTWYLWPSGVSGLIDSKVEWYDLKGNLLLCVDSMLTSTGMKNNQTGQVVKYLRAPSLV